MTSSRRAAASASTVGQRVSHASNRGTTRATCVCWSIPSETSTAYGSRRRRHGRSARCSACQARSADSTRRSVENAADAIRLPPPRNQRGWEVARAHGGPQGVRRRAGLRGRLDVHREWQRALRDPGAQRGEARVDARASARTALRPADRRGRTLPCGARAHRRCDPRELGRERPTPRQRGVPPADARRPQARPRAPAEGGRRRARRDESRADLGDAPGRPHAQRDAEARRRQRLQEPDDSQPQYDPEAAGAARGRDASARMSSRKRVRFAPSPTGSLHVGNALSALINRREGDWMLLRIDDTDPARNLPGGEEAILRDLEWLGIGWDEGPVRQSERQERYREAAAPLGARFEGTTLLREDGTATYQLASVVDDVDFGITHVVRGNDHRPNEPLQRRLFEALGARPPEFVHHGPILGEDGKKLAKRAPGATIASLREAGLPAEAVRRYLEELGVPKHDVHYDLPRIRRLAIEAIGAMGDAELAERVGAPVELTPALRGARDLNEAHEYAAAILEPASARVDAPETLERFRELLERANGSADPKDLLRELKAVGGDLRALRLALTGRDRGPELWAVVAALPKDEALRRIDAAL